MKLRYIFTALAAAALAFVGCQQEEKFLEEVQVSQSLIALPIEGGSAEITVTAADKWEIAGVPEWLTVAPVKGEAGETVVKFSAAASEENQEAVLYLNCREVSQVITVFQMAEKVELPVTDCATVLKENAVGTVYKCKGTITDLTNYDKYGCFYINDGTAQVYVYGSMNSTQFKPEVGDIITFEGPWTSYGNFDDVTILALEKSLIKLETVLPEGPISLEGGKVTVLLTVKGDGVEVVIPEDAAWITASEPGTIGNMTSFELTAAANEGGARNATVTFKTVSGGKDYVAMVDVEQLGAIKAVTVADFLAAAEGTALFELTGIVKNLANTTYGNFDLVDATGSVYVYGLTNNGAIGSNDKKFAEIGINEGDVITIIGTRAAYKGTPQVGGTAYLKEHVVAATPATVAEFLAQPKGTWCKITATLSNLKSDVYGNFDLVDETGSVYVYGLTTSYVAKNDKSFANLGLKEGDIVTLVGKRDSYNDQDQVGGPAYYISHEEGAVEVEAYYTIASERVIKPSYLEDGKTYVVFNQYYSDKCWTVVDGKLTMTAVEGDTYPAACVFQYKDDDTYMDQTIDDYWSWGSCYWQSVATGKYIGVESELVAGAEHLNVEVNATSDLENALFFMYANDWGGYGGSELDAMDVYVYPFAKGSTLTMIYYNDEFHIGPNGLYNDDPAGSKQMKRKWLIYEATLVE